MTSNLAMSWLNTQLFKMEKQCTTISNYGLLLELHALTQVAVLMRSCQQGTLLSPKQATHKSLHKEIPHKGTIVFPIGSYTNTYLHTGIQSLAFAVYKYTASLTVLAYINSGGELPCMLNTQLFNTKKQTR